MYLGLDLGTSGLKGIVIDAGQKVVAEAQAPLTVSRAHPGWSEQNPADWLAAAETVFDALSAQTTPGDVRAVGLSGQMHGATLLDARDEVLRPCMLWNDTRAHEQAAAMDDDADYRAITGNIVFPGFTAPKVAWVRDNEPEVFERISRVLLPKDYLRLWLTGGYHSDKSDAAGTSWLDTGKRVWSDRLLARTGLSRVNMPALVDGPDVTGKLRAGIVDRWGFSDDCVVAGGGGDNAASAIGVGVTGAGEAFVSLGTSGVLFAACDAYAPAPETAVHTFCHALPRTWHQMGVILSATDALNWYAGLVGADAADLTGELDDLQAPGRTLFTPYLGGERTPHNDAAVRGALVGLEHASGRQAVTRAVLEGVVHAVRDCRDALAATGTQFERLLAVGGGAKSDYWLKALATSLGVAIDVPVAGDFGGAFGAARLAMMAAGDLDADGLSQPPIARSFEPDAALADAFTEAHTRFRTAYQQTRTL
ncbi:xylulokinase [Roseitalea porphyridii]|uniref:Xylulose kinase n=1 Tax=Roseitalea porphyridii TaxID=1852022 RepID=A0A4P6V3I1_9HYPH|nr:xylulokinase [Roseitalea porphyridii]QBK31196.1 xylulokinase [Roseitalea porphyridii]